jgi:anhydro-N-acetylmuramic acid kinase
MESKEYRVIGMMSGTSLDGIDLVFCSFIYDKEWRYTLLASKTFQYTK